MTKKIIYFPIVLVLFVATGTQAQFDSDVSKVGITAAPFLTIGVGAKATGMGGAFVATASDASALFWNPSGIARIDHAEGIFSHINWIADINYDFIGFLLPTGRFGTVGASITTLSMEDMLVRTESEPLGTGEYFQSGDLSLALSYAVNLTDRFSIGFTGKYKTPITNPTFLISKLKLLITDIHHIKIETLKMVFFFDSERKLSSFETCIERLSVSLQ